MIDGAPGRLRIAVRLTDPASGRRLEVWTTQPGVQVYSGNSVRPKVALAKGYVPHGAISFQTQHYPDTPNHPNFPSTELAPGRCSMKSPNSAFGPRHSGQHFNSPELMQLFPTLVWKGDLKPQDYERLNRDILSGLGAVGAPLEGLRPGENWQSDHSLQERAAFGPLLEWVEAAAESALSYLRIARPLIVTGCWANVNAPGTGHRLHSHRNNYLSGAYYVQVQEGADSINFFDPKPQAGVIRPVANGAYRREHRSGDGAA